MLCSFAGGSVFHILTRLQFSSSSSSATTRFDFRAYHGLVLAVGLALLSFLGLLVFGSRNLDGPVVPLSMFLMLELAAGL